MANNTAKTTQSKTMPKMHGSLRTLIGAFARDRRGVIAIMLGLMFPVLLGFVGLGVEVGMWYEDKRDIQTAADAAAIAGAYELKDGGDSVSVSSVATDEAERNSDAAASGTITVSTPPNSGGYSGDTAAVEVEIATTTDLMFSDFFLNDPVGISSRAVAVSVSSGDEACVLALDSSAQRTINVSGTASVSMDGCQVASNSTASNSINVSGSANLEIDCATTVGEVNGTVTTTECDAPEENANTIEDPFADLEVPAFSGCDEPAGYTASDGETITPTSGTDTKVFCDGLTINAGDTVNFDPGVYIINEGTLKINGGAIVTGEDVTFIFTGSGIVDWADASVNGGGSVELSAPTSGDWHGILFFQDSDSATNSSNAFTFNGGSETELTGAIYVPNNDVVFSGGNDLDDNGCLLIVAQTVTFNGNADFENECDGIIPNPIYTSYTIRLVE